MSTRADSPSLRAPALGGAGWAYGLMAASAVLFATMNYFARVATASAHWATVAASRALLGAVVALAVARLRGASAIVRPSRLMWVRSFFGTASMACTFKALGDPRAPLGDTVTLLNLSPVFIALLAPLVLGERSGRRVFVALPLSAAGVALILRPSFLFHLDRQATVPHETVVYCILAAAFSACAMMALRLTGKQEKPEAIALHFSSFAFVFLGGLALHSGTPRATPSPSALFALVAAGLAGGLGQLAMTRAYALERAARLSPLGYLAVAVSALLGGTLLQDTVAVTSIVGMVLVVTGGVLLTWLGVRDAAKA